MSNNWRDVLLDREVPSVWGGIDCGDGWRPLIEFLYDRAEEYSCISVAQVKEKFGGLRFYFDHDIDCDKDDCCDQMSRYVDIIGRVSYKICEQCGAYGELRRKYNDGSERGWILTLCGAHNDREE